MYPSLQKIRNSLQHFNHAIRVNGDFKEYMEATIYLDPQPNDEDCIRLRQEDFLMQVMYNKEILRSTTIVFIILIEYLELKCLTYHSHSDTNRVKFGLIYMFLTREDEKQEDNSIYFACRTSQTDSTTQSSNNPTHFKKHQNGNDGGLNHLCNSFQKDERFTGRIVEDINEWIQNYKDAALDYKLDETQKLCFFQIFSDEESKRFYRE